MTSGQDVLHLYYLELKSDDKFNPDLVATVTVAVKAGQKVDGRTFRAAYFADESFFDRMAKQPGSASGSAGSAGPADDESAPE